MAGGRDAFALYKEYVESGHVCLIAEAGRPDAARCFFGVQSAVQRTHFLEWARTNGRRFAGGSGARLSPGAWPKFQQEAFARFSWPALQGTEDGCAARGLSTQPPVHPAIKVRRGKAGLFFLLLP